VRVFALARARSTPGSPWQSTRRWELALSQFALIPSSDDKHRNSFRSPPITGHSSPRSLVSGQWSTCVQFVCLAISNAVFAVVAVHWWYQRQPLDVVRRNRRRPKLCSSRHDHLSRPRAVVFFVTLWKSGRSAVQTDRKVPVDHQHVVQPLRGQHQVSTDSGV